jgi:integrase
LDKLQNQPLRFRKLLNEIEEGNKQQGSRTAQYVHMILKQALKDAVHWGIIRKNPMESIPPPKASVKREIHPLSVEEYRRFLDAAVYDRYFPLFALLLDTGLRPSEALGLQWSDVDLKKGVIHVRHSLEKASVAWRFKDPKTKTSRRTIPLTQNVSEILRTHRRYSWRSN